MNSLQFLKMMAKNGIRQGNRFAELSSTRANRRYWLGEAQAYKTMLSSVELEIAAPERNAA